MALDGRALDERALPEISPISAVRIGTLDLFPDG